MCWPLDKMHGQFLERFPSIYRQFRKLQKYGTDRETPYRCTMLYAIDMASIIIHIIEHPFTNEKTVIHYNTEYNKVLTSKHMYRVQKKLSLLRHAISLVMLEYEENEYKACFVGNHYYYYYNHFATLCPGLPRWVSTRRIKHSGFC